MRILASLVLLAACTVVRAPDAPSTRPSVATKAPAVVALDPMLRDYKYPFPVRYHRVRSQLQDLSMAYVDVAPTGTPNGRAALLLHGKNFSAAYWAPTIRALAAEGYRVIAPDQIGFGKSSKPTQFQYTFETLAGHTLSLLDALSIDRAAVVGHSMGGMLAARFALLYPTRIDRLVLVNPIGLEDYRHYVGAASIEALYKKELAQTPAKLRAYMKDAYFGGEWKREYEALLAIPTGWMNHPRYPLVAWNAALTAEMIYSQPVAQDLQRITVPTLLVIGQRDRTAIGKDRATPDVAARMGDYPRLGRLTRDKIAGARLVEIADAGHLPQVENWNAYRDALVDFLRTTLTPPPLEVPPPTVSVPPSPSTAPMPDVPASPAPPTDDTITEPDAPGASTPVAPPRSSPSAPSRSMPETPPAPPPPPST